MPRMRRSTPAVRILILTAQNPTPFAARAYQAGAQGFISKTQDMDAIVRCVESILGGFTVFPNGASANPATAVTFGETSRESPMVSDDEGLRKLSDRKWSSCAALARGMSNKIIGNALFISNSDRQQLQGAHHGQAACRIPVDLVDFARRCRPDAMTRTGARRGAAPRRTRSHGHGGGQRGAGRPRALPDAARPADRDQRGRHGQPAADGGDADRTGVQRTVHRTKERRAGPAARRSWRRASRWSPRRGRASLAVIDALLPRYVAIVTEFNDALIALQAAAPGAATPAGGPRSKPRHVAVQPH